MVAATIRTAMPPSSFLRASERARVRSSYNCFCLLFWLPFFVHFYFLSLPDFFIREISCWPKRNTFASVCIRQSSSSSSTPPSLNIVACVGFNGIDVSNLPMHAFALFVTEIQINSKLKFVRVKRFPFSCRLHCTYFNRPPIRSQRKYDDINDANVFDYDCSHRGFLSRWRSYNYADGDCEHIGDDGQRKYKWTWTKTIQNNELVQGDTSWRWWKRAAVFTVNQLIANSQRLQNAKSNHVPVPVRKWSEFQSEILIHEPLRL